MASQNVFPIIVCCDSCNTLNFMMALLFCETCFQVLHKTSGPKLSTMSSLLKAPPTCYLLVTFQACEGEKACGIFAGSVQGLEGLAAEKPSWNFLPQGCIYHGVIRMQSCLYLWFECRHIKKKISKELLCLMD